MTVVRLGRHRLTALKLNEAQLIENEQALTATVTDLRRSRHQLEKRRSSLSSSLRNTRRRRRRPKTRTG